MAMTLMTQATVRPTEHTDRLGLEIRTHELGLGHPVLRMIKTAKIIDLETTVTVIREDLMAMVVIRDDAPITRVMGARLTLRTQTKEDPGGLPTEAEDRERAMTEGQRDTQPNLRTRVGVRERDHLSLGVG